MKLRVPFSSGLVRLRLSTAAALCLALFPAAGCRRSPEQYVQLGNKLHDAGKYKEAALNYQQALKKEPRHAEAHYRMGLNELSRGDLRAATIALRTAVEIAPSNAEAKSQLAQVCLTQFVSIPSRPAILFNIATDMLAGLERLDPNGFNTRLLAGQIAMLNKRPEAIELLESARKLRPNDRRVLLPLVETMLQDSARVSDGERLALSTIESDTSFGPMYDLIYGYYVLAGRPADAEKILTRKLEKNPKQTDYAVQLAGFHAAVRDVAKAEQVLAPFTADSKYPEIWLPAGQMYLRSGHPDIAQRYLEKGLQADPSHAVEYRRRLAAIYWAGNRPKQAIETIQQALKDSPGDEMARRMRASFLLAMGKQEDLPTVIADYTALLAKHGNDRVLQYQLGRAFRARGDRNQAWKQFQAAIHSGSSYLSPRLSLAEMSAEDNRHAETLRFIDDILTVDPQNRSIRLMRAAALRNLTRFDEARSELRRLMSSDAKDPEAKIELGLLELSERKFQDAEHTFASIYQPGAPDPRPAAGLAEAYAAQKQFNKAVRIYDEEVRLGGGNVGALTAAAEMSLRAGNLGMALSRYKQVTLIEPQNFEALVRLGQLQLLNKEAQSGIVSLKQAAALAPKNVAVQLSLATGLHQLRRYDDAEAAYKAALQVDANNPLLLNNYAFFCAERKRNLDTALDMAQRAVKSNPDEVSYQDTLAFVYLQRRDVAPALTVLRRLAAQQPENALYHARYAVALKASGDTGKAQTELQLALAKARSAEEKEAISEMAR